MRRRSRPSRGRSSRAPACPRWPAPRPRRSGQRGADRPLQRRARGRRLLVGGGGEAAVRGEGRGVGGAARRGRRGRRAPLPGARRAALAGADPNGLDPARARGRALARAGVGQRRGGGRLRARGARPRGHRPRRHRRPGGRARSGDRGGRGSGDRPRRAAHRPVRRLAGAGADGRPAGASLRPAAARSGRSPRASRPRSRRSCPPPTTATWRAPRRGWSASSPPRCRASP